MKTFSDAVLAELRADGCEISTFIKIEIPDGDTLYLGGKDAQYIDGTTVTGRVIGYPTITAKVNWADSSIEDTGFTIELSNQPTGIDWKTLIEQFGTTDVFTIKVSVIILIAGEQNILFEGWIEKIDNYNENTMIISVRSGLGHIDTLIGTLLDNFMWSGAHHYGVLDSAKGKMMPLIWGKVENCPTIPVTGPWTATLKNDLPAITEDSDWLYFENMEYTMVGGSEGYFFVNGELIFYRYFNGDEQKVKIYKHDSADSSRGRMHTMDNQKLHKAGSKVIQWGSEVRSKMLIAGHACDSISDIKVDGETPPAADYDSEPNEALDTGWGGKKAQIVFNRNPVYPDKSGNTKTKKIYFNEKGDDNTAPFYQYLLESVEGEGPPGDRDPANIHAGQILDISVADRNWTAAKNSLGDIKSCKFIVKHKLNCNDSTLVKSGADWAAVAPKLSWWYPNGGFHKWVEQPLTKPQVIGDNLTEIISPRSGETALTYCRFRLEQSGVDVNFPASRIWNGDTSGTMFSNDELELFACCTHHDVGGGNTAKSTVTINVPQGGLRLKDISDVKIYCRAMGANYVDVFQIWSDTYTTRQDLPKTSNFGNIPLSEFAIPNTVTQFPSLIYIYAEDWSASVSALFVCSFLNLEITYKELENPTITQEWDVSADYKDWDRFDDANLRIEFPAGVPVDFRWDIYEAYFEVEYWPYKPFDNPPVTCTAVGREADSDPDVDYANPGPVLQDIIENWMMAKTDMTGMTIDPTSFSADDACIGYRLDKQQSVISVLTKFAYENRRWLKFDNLVWSEIKRYANWDNVTNNWTIDENDIVRGSLNVSNLSVHDLITSIQYKDNYNYADKTWGYQNEYYRTAVVGLKPMVMELFSHAKSATKYGSSPWIYSYCFSTLIKTYSFSVRPEGIKIEAGDGITINSYSPLGISTPIKILVLSANIQLQDLMTGTPIINSIVGIDSPL